LCIFIKKKTKKKSRKTTNTIEKYDLLVQNNVVNVCLVYVLLNQRIQKKTFNDFNPHTIIIRKYLIATRPSILVANFVGQAA
jgi:hypothetical protein